MARPLRLAFEGALYHVTSRGDRREPIVDYREGGHTQTAIAQATGLSVSRVSSLIAGRQAKSKT